MHLTAITDVSITNRDRAYDALAERRSSYTQLVPRAYTHGTSGRGESQPTVVP